MSARPGPILRSGLSAPSPVSVAPVLTGRKPSEVPRLVPQRPLRADSSWALDILERPLTLRRLASS